MTALEEGLRQVLPGPRGARIATVYLKTFTQPWLDSLIYALYSLAR